MVERSLPANLKGAATQAFTDQINNIISEPLIADEIRNNFISYSGVLKDGKFKTEDYLHAVAYVTFKLLGNSNQDAYFMTFPDRYRLLLSKGATSKEISAYVAAYNKGKLVNMIMEQSLVPSWVLNQDLYQKAINVQADLMQNASSEKVRTDAANSLLTHLAKPKEAGPLVSIDIRESSGLTELKGMLVQLAQSQQNAIKGGMTPKEIAGQKIIDVQAEEV
jgi:glutamine synthetase type III